MRGSGERHKLERNVDERKEKMWQKNDIKYVERERERERRR